MKLHIAVIFLFIIELNGAKLNNKKTLKLNPQSAIIAIQIVDPHENKTDTKNSKRTIDSSLGYGYQGIFGGKQPPARYEIYKYSQHDIPPYTGSSSHFSSDIKSENYNVQDAVSNPTHSSTVSNYIQPGTVLFSTIDRQGQLGGLSSQFPVSLENHHFPIPVIILRVHPSQLTNPGYPNLPQNHFLASTINSVDINSLLSSHVSNVLKQSPQYEPQYQQAQAYVQPEPEYQQQQQQQQQQQHYPQYQYEETQQVSESYIPQQELPEPRNPGVVSNFHYVASPSVYRQHTPVNDFNSPELLTHENYPSEKHTQVIFKRSKKVAGKPPNSKKQGYASVVVQPTKAPAPVQENQLGDEEVSDPGSKFVIPKMYYTVQYSDEQQYVYKKEPQYSQEEVRNAYRKVPEPQDYVYISTETDKRN